MPLQSVEGRLPKARVIGHRGACGHAPENTLASLRAAARLGVSWVEFDAKLSGDDVPLLMHDESLERTTDGHGDVADLDLMQLSQLDAGAWMGEEFASERIPTLEQALDFCDEQQLCAVVELKPCPGREAITAKRVAMAVAERQQRFMLSSFSMQALAVSRQVAPEVPRALLVERLPDDWLDRLMALDCRALHIAQEDVTDELVLPVLDAGFPVWAYTVNDPVRAAELYSWGVEAVFSDFPDRLRSQARRSSS